MTIAEEKHALAQSMQAVSAWDHLAKSEEFQMFLAKIQKAADAIAVEVLEGDFSPEVREAKRNHRLGLLAALSIPKRDRTSHVSTLKARGKEPGDMI